MTIFDRGVPSDFNKPTDLPADDEQRDRWQDANRSWWQSNPMRYDWLGENAVEEFSREFYEEVDRRFFGCTRAHMPWKEIPFDPLIDFTALAKQDVLEIGVGSGSHAQLLSSHAKSFNGIDLTDYAVESTRRRLACFGIEATIQQMDAENLKFDDNSFDFVWSWGVIHHSADTRKILSEIHRVLRPGGRCVTMVYHRSLWFYYIYRGLIPGLFAGKFFQGKSLTQVVEGGTDGAIARYYGISDWRDLVSEFMEVEDVTIYGQQNELLPLPGSNFKERVCDLIPDALGRAFLTTCKQGSFLVSSQRKRE
jgi:ubiquinone/menaquinone biosynthesis C-methylase UbiE